MNIININILLTYCSSIEKFVMFLVAASVLATALSVPAAPSGRVLFVVPNKFASPFGATSPQPSPSWSTVATHLAERLPGFDERLAASVVAPEALAECKPSSADVVVALGVNSANTAPALEAAAEGAAAVICYQCSDEISAVARVGECVQQESAFARSTHTHLCTCAHTRLGM